MSALFIFFADRKSDYARMDKNWMHNILLKNEVLRHKKATDIHTKTRRICDFTEIGRNNFYGINFYFFLTMDFFFFLVQENQTVKYDALRGNCA